MPSRSASGPTTFLATDVEGSTRLWSTRPDEMAQLSALHDRLLKRIFEEFSGSLVKRLWEGDSTFASFGSAGNAISAGIQIQEEAAQLRIGGEPLKIRVAIHSADGDGDPLSATGQELNRTLKMRSVAHGGQIIVSHQVVVEAAGRLPDGAALLDLGWHRLAYGSERVRLFQLSPPGSDEVFPPLRSIDSSPNNIGIQLTTFVGRVDERARMESMLMEPQAIAICGMPGIGKSRLAREVASNVVATFPDGRWVVDAHAIHKPEDLLVHLLQMIPGGDSRQLADVSALAIIDGDSDAEMILRCMSSVPDGIRVMAVSCFPPAIEESRIAKVVPLSVESDDGDGTSEAARMFLDRARERIPGGETESWGPVVEEIVRHLGGVPLAIEAVSAKVTAIGPEAILERLADDSSMLWGTRPADRSTALVAVFDRVFSSLTSHEMSTILDLAGRRHAYEGDLPPRLVSGGLVDVVDGEARLPTLVANYLSR